MESLNHKIAHLLIIEQRAHLTRMPLLLQLELVKALSKVALLARLKPHLFLINTPLTTLVETNLQ